MTHRSRVLPPTLAVLLLLAGCGGSDPPPVQNPSNSVSYELSCDSPIGTIHSQVTYVVTTSVDPIATGEPATFTITAPIANVKPPVSTTFLRSVSTFAVPAGLEVSAVSADPPTPGYTSANARVQDGSVVFTLEGSFDLDGSDRAVPKLHVTGRVTAAPGATVTWSTPTSVVGTGNAGFFGDQTSECHFENPGPIGVSHVSAAP